jgi:hypothetical protein
MLLVPKAFAIVMTTFAPLFTKRVWQHVQVLLVGAILAPGKRTVTAALRVMGLAQAKFFQQYHRVLNRAVWSSLEGARLLLVLLVSILAPAGPLIMGLDDTLERRRGAKIQAAGMYRDAVLFAPPHGERDGLALVESDALGRYSLGHAIRGFAVFEGPGAFRA